MSLPAAIDDFIFANHALFEMARRGISESEVAQVLSAPEQSEMVRAGRAVYQARFNQGTPTRTFLLRVFVDIDRRPPEVVTAYWTSKVDKYWR
ncbi:MAG: DUF4258 domain-containing protein [Anaerolineae bacterium CFX3]|jgi:hypothetical protein|nr:DUF4258 domain-containing protein [Anaerolineae bacterium]MBL1172150.1 DUF4258 domain-containing protein [Chloroflexota bacterium]MBW7919933.1 DUF4258 domain-containing protein [Anaerolineales bacterium]MCE7906574.1 DUF4258 domain-containing protein [Anaerolineae bacterium CFX3]MDL1925925.1 DUF4258 domain-containing protein [Anaerolineae bacterium AMX1]